MDKTIAVKFLSAIAALPDVPLLGGVEAELLGPKAPKAKGPKITSHQTKPSKGTKSTAQEIAIRANATSIAELDTGEALGLRLSEFGALFEQKGGRPLAIAEFKARRLCWISAYVEAMGCQISSAATRFAEMVKTCNVVKAQSAEALRKAAERAAKKAVEKAQAPAIVAADSEIEPAGLGLSELESRVIGFMRAKKWEMAAECIAQAADAEV